MTVLLLLSGAIATGKTAVAERLAAEMPGDHIRVRAALGAVLGINVNDRAALQREGADLDRRTRGRWLRDYLAERYGSGQAAIVDSLRTELQTLAILETEVDSRLIFLEAHESTRRARYARAAETDPVKASLDFDTAMRHPTEQRVGALRPIAHLTVQTDELAVADLSETILWRCGCASLVPPSQATSRFPSRETDGRVLSVPADQGSPSDDGAQTWWRV